MSIRTIEKAAEACDRAIARHNADLDKLDALIAEAKAKKKAADAIIAAPGAVENADEFSEAITASATAEMTIRKLQERKESLEAHPALDEGLYSALCSAVVEYVGAQEKTKVEPVKQMVASKAKDLRSLSDEVVSLNDAFIIRYGNMARMPYVNKYVAYNRALDAAEALENLLEML